MTPDTVDYPLSSMRLDPEGKLLGRGVWNASNTLSAPPALDPLELTFLVYQDRAVDGGEPCWAAYACEAGAFALGADDKDAVGHLLGTLELLVSRNARRGLSPTEWLARSRVRYPLSRMLRRVQEVTQVTMLHSKEVPVPGFDGVFATILLVRMAPASADGNPNAFKDLTRLLRKR